MIRHLLFVCTGNSCRSVMAQAYLRHVLEQLGVAGVSVESAGIFAIEGMPATRETLSVLRSVGIDVSNHHAQGVTADVVERADAIFAMEQLHADEIARRYPHAAGKAHLLKTYGLPQDDFLTQPGIHDPIGKPLEIYEVCFGEIKEAVERIAKTLNDAARS